MKLAIILKLFFFINFVSSDEWTKSLLVPVTSRPSVNCSCGLEDQWNENKVLQYFKRNKVEHGEAPWLVGLVDTSRSDQEHFCFGTIINDRYVLTPSSCLHKKKENTTGVNLLGLDANDRNVHPVSKFKFHSRFSGISFENDLALVQLRDKLNFHKEKVHPVCLEAPGSKYAKDDPSNYKYNVVTWWKHQKEPGYPWVTFFGKQEVVAISSDQCSSLYPKEVELHSHCLKRVSSSNPQKYLLKENSEFFCHIAAGMPLVRTVTGESQNSSSMVGIATKLSACSPLGDNDREVNIFLTVKDYLPWILQNSYDGSYCNGK